LPPPASGFSGFPHTPITGIPEPKDAKVPASGSYRFSLVIHVENSASGNESPGQIQTPIAVKQLIAPPYPAHSNQ